jgi:hypothetical protein
MRIEGPSKPSGINSTEAKNKAAAAGDGGVFGSLLSAKLNEGKSASETAKTASLSGLDPLYALQEVSGEEERKKQMRQGKRMLELLEEIRDGLLAGSMPESRLLELEKLVHTQRAATVDPRLLNLLSEIETRAAVELAKLGR